VNGGWRSQIGALALIAVASSGCGPEGVDPSGSSSSAPLPAGPARYAVQWSGYVAGFAGQATYAQLAFIDVGGSGVSPALNALELISDGRPIPAVVEVITPGSPGDGEGPSSAAMFSALIRVDGLASGRYEWNRIRYVDEGGVEREVGVGNWLFDIRPPEPEPLRETEGSVGSTSFGVIETVLENTSSGDIAIHGLAPLDLPGFETQVLMNVRTEASSTATATGAPSAGGELKPVMRVALAPQRSIRLVFQIEEMSPGDLHFAVIRPLLRYRADGDEGERLFALSMQVYASPFAGAGDLAAYLNTLPADASHPLAQP
jgi:hypothetical protein